MSKRLKLNKSQLCTGATFFMLFFILFFLSLIFIHFYSVRWLNLILNATISQVHSLLLSIFWSVFDFFSVEAKMCCGLSLISWQLPFCIRKSYCLIASHCEFKTVRRVKYKIKMINEIEENVSTLEWTFGQKERYKTKTITKKKWN